MRHCIVLMSSIELICVAMLIIIISIKEHISKNIVDLRILLIMGIMLIALIWFIYTVIFKNKMDI